MRPSIKQRRVLGAETDNLKDDEPDFEEKRKKSQIQRKDGGLLASCESSSLLASCESSEQADMMGDGEVSEEEGRMSKKTIQEETRLRDGVDLGHLLLPLLLLVLLHWAGLKLTTMLLVGTATVLCLVEYIL